MHSQRRDAHDRRPSGSGVLDLTGSISTSIGRRSNVGATHAIGNTGAINVTGGTLTVTGLITDTGSSTITIGSGATLTTAESDHQPGTIKLNNGTLTDSGGLTISAGAALTGNGTVSAAITGVRHDHRQWRLVDAERSGRRFRSGFEPDHRQRLDPATDFLPRPRHGEHQSDPHLHRQRRSVHRHGRGGRNPASRHDLGLQRDATKIQIKAIGSGDTVSWNSGTNELTISNGSGTSETFTFAAGTQGQYITVSDVSGVDTLTICFMAGTMIRTPDGEVAVEALKPGDLVLTTTGEAKPVNWVGRQTVSKRFADPLRSYPIRVRAGALDDNTPVRDLLISPDHALLVGGVMVQAGALVNGTSITRERTIPDTFVYYHVELDDHSLILAEGAPAETFVDNVDRMNFDNWSEYQALYPQGKTVDELPYPRAKSHRQVPVPLRVALAERALGLGAGDAAEVA